MIYLIGFMGSGKSTVAEQLSEDLQLPYIEMDQTIEKTVGMSIAEMFERYGESYFREKESQLLKDLKEESVVSTGGGIILTKENRESLKQGTVIYLKASWETITKRLENDSNRPLWKGNLEERKQRFLDRLPLYEEVADEVVCVDHQTPESISRSIKDCLKR